MPLAVLVPMALALWQELAYLGAQVDPQRPLVELAAQKPLAQAGGVSPGSVGAVGAGATGAVVGTVGSAGAGTGAGAAGASGTSTAAGVGASNWGTAARTAGATAGTPAALCCTAAAACACPGLAAAQRGAATLGCTCTDPALAGADAGVAPGAVPRIIIFCSTRRRCSAVSLTALKMDRSQALTLAAIASSMGASYSRTCLIRHMTLMDVL